MLLIKCPHCGPRAQIEFTYRGDATVARPADPDAVSIEAWLDHIYFRDNPRGPHSEWWHHHAGCRRWIKVRRDTWTHEILATGTARDDLGEDEHR
ncbi:MAG: sarcosine oxidase subunit delta [Burkholderiales bacterium]|nr:sarcosine oxidase subunit delta [Burkholderiales bacterium]